MRLTRRDGLATIGLLVVGGIVLAIERAWDLPLLGSYRTGIAALSVVGLMMCAFGGGALTADSFKSPVVQFSALLGAGAMVLLISGLVTGTRTPFIALAVLIAVLWAITTLRHEFAAEPRVAVKPVHAG